jgi:hypothetical protein
MMHCAVCVCIVLCMCGVFCVCAVVCGLSMCGVFCVCVVCGLCMFVLCVVFGLGKSSMILCKNPLSNQRSSRFVVKKV